MCVPPDPVWIANTLRPSSVNPILASVSTLFAHILPVLSQKDHFCPHGNRSCLCPIPPHTPYIEAWVTRQWHHTELRLVAENPQPDVGGGLPAFLTCLASPGTLASQCARLETFLVQARPRSSTFLPLGVGGLAALPTLEASHMGGPAFMCKFTCM